MTRVSLNLRGIVAAAAAACGLIFWQPAAAAAAPALNCSSVGISATMNTFATVGVGPQDWVENLGFDGRGGLWASELELGKLVRFGAQGTPGRSLTLATPGASGLEPDGHMFALYGDSDFGSTPGAAPAGVVTFDPAAATPVAKPFVSGFTMANGGALDAEGNLYVANSLKSGILKFSPKGVLDAAFENETQISSADGVAIDGDTLYVTEIFSTNAALVKVPLNDPSKYTLLAALSPLAGPDDLAVGPDGALYVALASGQVVRVNPQTGAACVVIDTGVPVTSVRFPIDFAPYSADGGDAFVSSELGSIFRIHMTGLKPLPVKSTTPVVSVTIRPRRIPPGKRRTVTVRVSSDPSACERGATVRVGRYRTRTGGHGRAKLHVRFTRVGRHKLTVRKTGCPTTTTTLTVGA
jgi:virginiamycin B lyase